MKNLKYKLYKKHISFIHEKNKFIILSFKKYLLNANFISKQLFHKKTKLFCSFNETNLKFPLYLNIFKSSKSLFSEISLTKELNYILFIKYNYLKIVDKIHYIKFLNSSFILKNFRFLTFSLNILF